MNESLAEPRSRKWRCPARTVIMSVLILALGCVIGSFGTLIAVRHFVSYQVHHLDELEPLLINWAGRVLDLTPEEEANVREVFARRLTAIGELRRERYPLVEAQLQAIRKEVSEALAPEKARKWQAKFDRVYRVWRPAAPMDGGQPRQGKESS